MIPVGPVTAIVLVVCAVCAVAGAAVFFRAWSTRRAGGESVCRRCRNVNPAGAKYCTHCGQPLDAS